MGTEIIRDEYGLAKEYRETTSDEYGTTTRVLDSNGYWKETIFKAKDGGTSVERRYDDDDDDDDDD